MKFQKNILQKNSDIFDLANKKIILELLLLFSSHNSN